MTEEQRQQALTLCERILETAAKLQADLQQVVDVIEEEIEATNLMPSSFRSLRSDCPE